MGRPAVRGQNMHGSVAREKQLLTAVFRFRQMSQEVRTLELLPRRRARFGGRLPERAPGARPLVAGSSARYLVGAEGSILHVCAPSVHGDV